MYSAMKFCTSDGVADGHGTGGLDDGGGGSDRRNDDECSRFVED